MVLLCFRNNKINNYFLNPNYLLNSMWLLILKALYFFLPAYFANMAPVIFKWIPVLNKPVYERWFGRHKTWRGLLIAIVVGGLVFWLQKIAYISGFRSWAVIDYSDFSLLLGFLMGGGAIIGDMVESFFKRKFEIKEGKPWIPWDQLDFVLGGLIFSFLVFVPPAEIFLLILILSPLLHIVVNYIGYLLGIRKVKW